MSGAPVLCYGALLLIVPSVASAAAGPDRPAPDRRVELVVAAAAEALSPLEGAVREALAGKGVGLVAARKRAITPEDVALATTAPAGGPPSVVARVFVDLKAPDHATLFLIDPRRGRIHVRRVALDHGFDAVARTSLVFVIGQSIDAILEGRAIGVTREEYERSLTPPPPVPAPAAPTPPVAAPAPPRDAPRVLLAGGYEGVAVAAGAFQHAAKLVVAARFARFQVAGGARLAAPFSISGGGVEAQLWNAGFTAAAAAAVLGWTNLTARVGLGAGLDMTRIAPSSSAPEVEAAGVSWASAPSLRPFLEVEGLFGRVAVSLAAGAEAHLLAERYTVRIGGEARDVFVPRRVRPAVALMVGIVF